MGTHRPPSTVPPLLFATSAWLLAVGVLVRIRIAHDVPLPSPEPTAWLLMGTLEDLGIIAIIAAIALTAARWFPRTARASFLTFAFVMAAAEIILSEAVVFFGTAVRAEDLHGDIPLTLAAGSLRGAPIVLAAAAAALSIAVPFGVRRLRSVPWFNVRSMIAIGVASTIATFCLTQVVPRARIGRNPILALFAIERERMQSPHERFDVASPSGGLLAIREFAGQINDRQYVDAGYPLAYRPLPANQLTSLKTDLKPNIVFILMESVRAEEVGCYGADPPGVTPNIDAIARAGIRFDPAFSAGTYTASAELATWYGLPPIPREVLMTSRPDVELTGFPELLHMLGWRSLYWIHGGDSNFYRRDSFYIPRGVRVIDARSFPSTDPSTNWGYSDRSAARNAITVLNRAPAPFAAMFLTLTNHHPFQLPADADPPLALPAPPADAKPGRRSGDMVNTVHYTDEAVGDFFRAARTQPWFSRTIFVITGDHGSEIEPYDHTIRTRGEMLQLAHRVPLIIYSPLLAGGMTIPGPASAIDVLPTILHLIHSPVQTGLGVDLFDPAERNARVLPMWNPHQRVLTLATTKRTYRAEYAGSAPLETQTPDETLFDPVRDPNGLHNLAAIERTTTAHFRELAKVYIATYPWLVIHGRSGLPPEMLQRNFSVPTARPAQQRTSLHGRDG